MNVRTKRYLIAWGLGGVFALLTLAQPVFAIPIVLLLIPRLRFWVYRLAISDAKCPSCGRVIPLEASWQCGSCGFVQHRHAYKPCSKCKHPLVETACPSCKHGVFL